MKNHGTLLGIVMPREDIEARILDIDALHRQAIQASPATRLLAAYASSILSDEGELAPHEEQIISTHIEDLLVLALGTARSDETEAALGRGGRAALFSAMKADIGKNLMAPDLSLNWLAGRYELSSRAIRNLFYASGTNFTDYVLSARLERAREMLSDPDYGHFTITSIAYQAGFGDLSWFNQAFWPDPIGWSGFNLSS